MRQLLSFMLLLATLTVQAQTKLSENPEDFVMDVKAMLIAGKIDNAEQLSANLNEVWNSNKLTAKQQKEVIAISQEMHRKKMRINPHFAQFYTMLTAGVTNRGLQGSSLDDMLKVTAKVLQQDDAKTLEQFLHTVSLYLSTNQLYQSSYYSLQASGGSFGFAYEGKTKASEAGGNESDSWNNISWDDEVNENGELIEEDGWGTITNTSTKEGKKKSEKKRKESIKQQFVPAQPAISGPVLKLDNTTLTIVTDWDSTAIEPTSGQLMLANNLFVGEGGTFKWKVNGQPATAEFHKYNFSITVPGLKVPDATVTYPSVLATPVDGMFEWLSSQRKAAKVYPYPKFQSFTTDAQLKTLGNNIAYKGGFSLTGGAIGSKPLDGSISEIVVSHKGVPKFRSRARNYTLTDSLILTERAAVAIYQNQDSITHPAMQLSFSKPNQELTLIKDKGAYGRTPFYDTYHKLEIVAERLQWKIDENDIDFSILNTKTLVPMQLESTEYYSNNRYQQLVGVATFHPLQILVGHAIKTKSSSFYASDVAKTTNINENAIKEAAANLSHDLFLDYDPASGYISLKPKALHYVKASKKLTDYDYLIIKSIVPSGRNATLNLESNKLTVRGVEMVTFNNDSAAVYALPKRNEIHILKNRDIEFDGQVYARHLAFKGADFKFNYDDYYIDLAKLDTIAIVSSVRGAQGGRSFEQVLTGKGGAMSGKLYISKPNNKSGKEFYPEYPMFDAPVGAMVAFSKKEVLGGAYDSTVYFDMPPFKLDSLSSGKENVAFDGTFNSGGIFPPIKTQLQIMPDGAFGFYYEPPTTGLPVFGGKGMVYDTIMMSAGGIQSKGKITYLAATLEAPDFTYYQNAVTTKKGAKVSIAEGVNGRGEFPVATAEGFNMNWQPLADTMYIQTQEKPMKVYEEEFEFKGVAKLTLGGFYGSGVVDNAVANVTTQELQFKQRSINGNHAQVIAKSDVEGRPAVKAKDMAFNYDLTEGYVDFESEQKGVASIEFPKARYKTSVSSARWDMNQQSVSLKADENKNNNWFYSLHPEQDSLKFMAATGEYNLKNNTLLAGGVPYIAVADVYVVPDSGQVAVAADATIQTLVNAKVLADSAQQHHKLYGGNINILSRKAFNGSAILDYHNPTTDSVALTFRDFVYGNPREGKAPVYTFASAQVEENSPLYIFPKVQYRGKVTMHAPEKFMNFDGELKLNFTGNPADSDWFPYKKDTLNPDNLRIPIVEPKAIDGAPLYTGLHISRSTAGLYNTFVSKKQEEDDLDLFTVQGLLSYNKEEGEFKLGDESRVNAASYEGNVLRYNEASKTIHFEGKLNLLKPTKGFLVEAAGNGSARTDSNRYNLDAFLALDMDVPSQALAAMAESIKTNTGGAGEALDRSEATMYKLAAFIGDKDVQKYKERSSVEYVPLPKVSNKLVRSMILNQVNLKWSDEQKAWYSVGKISMACMGKEDINAQLDGYLEVRQDMNGEPALNLYLQAGPYAWYYISFFENGLVLASSDQDFNKVISSKSRRGRGSTSSFGFYAGEPIEKNQFLEYFQTTYLNGKQEFKIVAEQPVYESTGNFEFLEEDSKKEKKKKRKKDNTDAFGVEEE